MREPRVILIGGAPGAGKTTLGRALAARLGVTSLTADDLMSAAKAVTTPATHPGLHVVAHPDAYRYFTEGPAERLIADASAQHEAAWPAILKVIRNHATWGAPVVIDGWAMRPDAVADLELDGVASFWLVVEPSVLEERERRNTDFFGRSADPERMIRNFLARSRWYNDLVRERAAARGLEVLHQDGTSSVEELRDEALARIPGRREP